MSADLLVADGLCRSYGSLSAVDRVDLRIAPGARHGLIGPNGAGKSTLLDLLAGSTRPDGGRIRFDGRDVTRLGAVRRARQGIGRTHQRPAVWPSMSTLDNVVVAGWRQAGGFRAGLTGAAVQTRMRGPALESLDRMGLADEADTPAARLSHGQRRQLEIAMALAGGSRLLLLDEPAAGLSTPELSRLWDVLTGLPRTVAVLLVEHRLDMVYALADTVTVLSAGRVAATGAATQVQRSAEARRAFAETVVR